MTRWWRSALLFAGLLATGPVDAQLFNLDARNNKVPLEIQADDGIEWQRDQRTFIARGNARAVQGEVSVSADSLTATYREVAGGRSEIERLEAVGRVRIRSGEDSAEGERGVYDLDKGLLVLTGRGLVLTTRTDRITARDSLEYWDKRQIAVARGDARAARGDNRLRGDVLTAYLRNADEKAPDKSPIKLLEAKGGVIVSTPREILRGGEGRYDTDRELAEVMGDVKITRGGSQLNGDRATINMRTGVSRLVAAPGRGDGRVRGMIVPDSVNDRAPQRRAKE
jgi:lipopolysaccharide export system protein LptA